LHHDNAPAHNSAHVVQQFLAKHDISICSSTPLFARLGPCDFFSFPKMKITLKGQRFQDVDGIKYNAKHLLREMSKNDFQKCFQKWQGRCRRHMIQKKPILKEIQCK